MSVHTQGTYIAYMWDANGNYAAGSGTVAYATGMMSGSANILPFPQLISAQTMPKQIIERVPFKALNMGTSHQEILQGAAKYEDGKLTTLFQNGAFFVSGAAPTVGQIPSGFTMQWYNKETYNESYGNVIKEWELESKANNDLEGYTKQILTIDAHKTITGAIPCLVQTGFMDLTTYPPSHYSVCSMSVSGADYGVQTLSTKDFNIKFTNEFGPTQFLNNVYKVGPQILKRDWEINATFTNNVISFVHDLKKDENVYYNITAKVASNNYIDFTGVYIDDASNLTELPEFGFYEYKVTFKNGSGFAYNWR